MFSKARTLSPVDAALVADFFARGGQVTKCPTRRAHSQSPGAWAKRVDDRSIA